MRHTLTAFAFCLCASGEVHGQSSIEHDVSFWMDIPFKKEEIIAPPVLWYILRSKYVITEVRWNFETSKSISLYLGKTFSLSGEKMDVSITPSIGGIIDPDGYQAWSPQVTLDIESDRGLYLFSFSQFIISGPSYWFYQWAEFGFVPFLSVDLEMGLGWQLIFPDESSTNMGIFFRYILEMKSGEIHIESWPQYDPINNMGGLMFGITFLVE